MKKRLLFLALVLVLCLGLSVPAMAADYTEVIPCRYDNAGYFHEGLAAVEKDGKWGYIDKTGKEVVPCIYDEVEAFSDGIAFVREGRYWGLIDKSGNEVIPCKYWHEGGGLGALYYCFHEGLAKVTTTGFGNYGYIDKTGEEVVPCQYDNAGYFQEGLAAVTKDGKWGYIDKTGKEVIPCQYDYAEDFCEGVAAVGVGDYPNEKWGYIDRVGKEIVPCIYDVVGDFSEGLAWVRVGKYWDGDQRVSGKYGFVDKTGKEVVPPKYDYAWNFSEGLAVVSIKDEWGRFVSGYIDKTGKEVIPPKYLRADDFSDGFAAVGIHVPSAVDLMHGYIDRDGNEVIPCQYAVPYNFSEGLAVVANKYWKYGVIDKTGKEVAPCIYDTVEWGRFSDGLALVEKDGKWGYIDKTGKEVVPCLYDYGGSFSEGFAAVQRDGKWGFIRIVAQVSDWAKEQVNRADEAGLVPNGLGTDYRVQITRAQFAAVAVKLYEAMSGQNAPTAGESPFSDTGDTAVIQAEAMGFVSGVGGGRFDPNALVTREQAAAMLSRVYTKLGGNIPAVTATSFADNGSVSAWARDSVAFMSDKGIVSGVGDNKFNPQGNASIEQALAIAVRMFDNLK